jgi:hypothetical protein
MCLTDSYKGNGRIKMQNSKKKKEGKKPKTYFFE